MISGAERAKRRAAFLLAAILLVPGCGAAAESDPAWDVSRLMRGLGQVKSAKARFVERKEIAILNAPLESSGTLIYTAPGKLEKHTLAPRPESLVLEGDRLTLESKARNQSRTFALREHPVIWAFVESIRSTLAGGLATLSRFYKVSLQGAEQRWRLVLKPIEPAMQGVVSEIAIEGSRDRVSTIEIAETNGDRSLMTITPEP
jgi:outer membrane lipoprotein-sorting protein